MKKLILLVLVLLSFSSFAQINYELGYSIDNSGTKKEHLIRNIAWKNNPIEFDYRDNETSSTQKATIQEIKEFSVSNYKFKRFTVNIDRSTNDVNRLSQERNPIFKQETLFLKLLVEGEANLYQYEDNNLVRYFISTENHEKAEQLIYKEYIISGTQVGKNSQFRQQLLNALKSDKLLQRDFEKVEYTRSDLVDLFLKYNESKNSSFSNFEAKQSKGSLNLKIVAGANFASLSFNSTANASGYDFDSKAILKAGFEVEYILPFNQNKWSLFTDPSYQSYTNQGKKFSVTTEAEYKFIELPIGLRHYFFLNDKSRIFINGGYALAFNSDSFVRYGTTKLDIRKSSNYFIGAGFRYGKYGIEARYNFNRGLLDRYNYWESDWDALALSVSYTIL